MNNSFPRLIDGMCATLRAEVLPRLDDEFARGQVFGVINLLNTFKVRADWSSGFLEQQITAQREALDSIALLLDSQLLASSSEPSAGADRGPNIPANELLAMRDENNRAIAAWLEWLGAEREKLGADRAQQAEKLLRKAMRAEVDIELKNSPRPLFAEMSSGSED